MKRSNRRKQSMTDEANTKETELETSQPKEESTANFSLREIAEALQERIRNYSGGGKTGVYNKIDQGFKPVTEQPQEDIKYPKDSKTLTKGNFFKEVDRLTDIKENMTFGLKGNINLLFNVFEILGIKNISDLMGTSYKKPNFEEYIIDTNVKAVEIREELDKISEELRIARLPKPHFPTLKVCNDWLTILYEFYKLRNNSENNSHNPMTFTNILNIQMWQNIFLNNLISPIYKFGVRLNYILNKYEDYFAKDTLLHKNNYAGIATLDTSDYLKQNKIFILSPFFALYFLVKMYKQFIYSLNIDKTKKGEERYDFISSENISEKIKNIMGDKKTLGSYIHSRLTNLLNYLSQVLESAMEPERYIPQDNYDEYLKIFQNVFDNIYGMNIDNTKINEKWVNETISKIKNLNDFYNKILFGRAIFILPTDDNITSLNYSIQAIETIAVSMKRDNG
jgi:hypothetical protein